MTCLRSVPPNGQCPGTQPSPTGGVSYCVVRASAAGIRTSGRSCRWGARGTLPHACRVRRSNRPDAGGPPYVQAGNGSTEVTPG